MRTMTAVLAASLLIPGAQAHAAGGPYGEAFGLYAEGLVAIAPTPYVKSTTKDAYTKALVKIPPNALLSATVNEATASKTHAKATLVDVGVGQLGLRATVVTASCVNGTGGAHLAKVKLGGQTIPVYPKPNSGLSLPLGPLGTAEVTFNKQVKHADGSLSVTAIYVEVSLADVVKQKIAIAGVRCAPAAEAPKPAIIKGELVVTG